MNVEINELSASIDKLLVFRHILKDEIIKDIKNFISSDLNNEGNLFDIYSKLIQVAETKKYSGNILKNHLIDLLLTQENLFSAYCEKIQNEKEFLPKGTLFNALLSDIEIISKIYNFNLASLTNEDNSLFSIVNDYVIDEALATKDNSKSCKEELISTIKEALENKNFEAVIRKMASYYKSYGCGTFGDYLAFKWSDDEEKLEGVTSISKVTFDDLVGYENQKKILIENTEAFVKGKTANNVLLFGDKGTGKSSAVKALLNKYSKDGLRVIEITKEQLKDFPKLIKEINNRGYRFIIFLDDLSFEEFEIEYKHMKSLIEGGIEEKPENVLIYATSNRRHLIKQTWKDRESAINPNESAQETLSLADRFGITITFTSPAQDHYLQMVYSLAKKNNINLPEEVLREEAIKWELKYHGRSGRTAQQFINYIGGLNS